MASRNKSKFLCMDCNIDTGRIGEHYMLVDSIWRLVHNSNKGMLCIKCLEARLGRTLNKSDFNNSYLNNHRTGFKSALLTSRMVA